MGDIVMSIQKLGIVKRETKNSTALKVRSSALPPPRQFACFFRLWGGAPT